MFNKKIYYYLLIFFLGGISSFSLPPYNFFIINFFSFSLFLAILFFLKEKKVPLIHFFFIGLVFGYSFFLFSLYWISNSLKFDHNLSFLIPITIFGLPLLLSLFYGLASLCTFFWIKNDYKVCIVFAFFLSLFEYLRSILFTGFPWNLIVYSWSGFLEQLQILKYIGTYTLNFLSILIFSSFFLNFIKFKIQKFLINISIILLVLLANYIFGYRSLLKKDLLHDSDFNIKIIQPNISIVDTWGLENQEKNILKLISLSKSSENKKTIFIWPEGMIQHSTLNGIKKYQNVFLKNFKLNDRIIVGVTNPEFLNNRNIFFNSLIILNNNADILQVYNKINLVPFGEFIPFEDIISKYGLKKVTFGYGSFSKGDKRNSISIGNLNFLPLICYEIIFSGKLNPDKENFSFIINISEDAWFGNTIGPYQHLAHAVFRAVEEGKFIYRSTNKGISAIVNDKGQILYKIPLNKEGFIESKLLLGSKNTFFSKYNNNIFYFILLLNVIFLIFFFNKKNYKI